MEKEQGSVMVNERVIIDTRPPFQSVKEAVALFGEKVLVGEIYANQLKQIQVAAPKIPWEKQNVIPTLGVVSVELEETKKNLQKVREEGNYMANCLKSLKEQLEETKRELRLLKATKEIMKKEHHSKVINPEIEDLTFVNNAGNGDCGFDDDRRHENEIQKKKFVTFASPPSLTREIRQDHNIDDERARFGRTPSFRIEGKKKAVNSTIMGWFFPRKK